MSSDTHLIQVPIEMPDVVATNVPTPSSGYLTVFSEGGKLKQKDSAGVVTDLTATGGGGGGGFTYPQILSFVNYL